MAIPLTLGAKIVRPQSEAPLARRTAIVAFLFFLSASFFLAVEGVNVSTLQRAFPLYALGGFSILIFGTSRLLIAGMAGRDIVGGKVTSLLATTTAALGAAGVFLLQDGALIPRVVFAVVWSVGAWTHVVVTILTVRKPATRAIIADPTATRASRRLVRFLEAGSLFYAAASALVVPLAFANRVSLASAVHLTLVGFVIVTIMSVATHILPRFTRAPIAAPALWVLVPFALVGPILMALALNGERGLLRAAALSDGFAFATFGVMVIVNVARSSRVRPANLAYVAAPLAIGVGGILGLLFALRGSLADQLATHGLLNVFGFVGLFVMGASTDLYGPSLQPGAAPARRHVAVVLAFAMLGLAVAALGSWFGAQLLARFGMLAYSFAIGWQLAGIVSSHRRAGRVLLHRQ